MNDLVVSQPASLPAIADRAAVEPELPRFMIDALDYDLETDPWRRDFLSRHGKGFSTRGWDAGQIEAAQAIARRYAALLAPPPLERVIQWLDLVNVLVANPKPAEAIRTFAMAMGALDIPTGYFTARTATDIAKGSRYFPTGKDIHDAAAPLMRRWRIIHNRLKDI
jgi:hypothetical protein